MKNINVKPPFHTEKYQAKKKQNHSFQSNKEERIAKRLSALGVASRREAEEMIRLEKVKINGSTANVTMNVSYQDKITVDDKEIANVYIKPRLFLMNKPAGFITSTSDPQGRRVVFDLIPEKLGKLMTVGRLDFNTEGLLLLTNNGEIARYLELPSNKIQRVYRARVLGDINVEKLRSLKNGVKIDGVDYGKIIVIPEKYGKMANSWLKVIITEGKNREVRKILAYCGLKVGRLIRIQYGQYRVSDIPPGCIIETRILPKIHLMHNNEETHTESFKPAFQHKYSRSKDGLYRKTNDNNKIDQKNSFRKSYSSRFNKNDTNGDKFERKTFNNKRNIKSFDTNNDTNDNNFKENRPSFKKDFKSSHSKHSFGKKNQVTGRRYLGSNSNKTESKNTSHDKIAYKNNS